MSKSLPEEKVGGIQVIARAAKILNALSLHSTGITQAELAKAVDLPKSTVQRIVMALADEDIVKADRSDGVSLGSALLRLVARVHTDVVSIVTPRLEELSAEVNETVTLGRMSGTELAFIHVIVAEHTLRVAPRLGGDLPIHSTGGGRALLSLMSNQEVRALLGDTLARVTPQTVHSHAQLARALDQIRLDGYAWESDETEIGITSLGFPVDTVLGRYAVSIVLPSARLGNRRKHLIEQAFRTKAILQNEMGMTSETSV